MPPKALNQFEVAWDPLKEIANFRKHGLTFESAMTVLHDPLALSRHDTDHNRAEERWVTLGSTSDGALAVVVHTFEEVNVRAARVRIISARRPTRDERRQYESGRFRIQAPFMQDEYDFSDATRGKFYREGTVITGVIRVDADVLAGLSALAVKTGKSASQLIREMLKRQTAAAS